MKQLIFSFCLLLLIGTVSAQPYLTLQSAIDTALSRNFDVRQRGLVAEQAEANMKQARANLLPDLGATINHGVNQGRSIDPFTNQFVDQTVNYAGYGLNSGIVLFNGLNLQTLQLFFADFFLLSGSREQIFRIQYLQVGQHYVQCKIIFCLLLFHAGSIVRRGKLLYCVLQIQPIE